MDTDDWSARRQTASGYAMPNSGYAMGERGTPTAPARTPTATTRVTAPEPPSSGRREPSDAAYDDALASDAAAYRVMLRRIADRLARELPIRAHTSMFRTYVNTFTGAECVDFLVSRGICRDPWSAVATANDMCAAFLMCHAKDWRRPFKGKATSLYRLAVHGGSGPKGDVLPPTSTAQRTPGPALNPSTPPVHTHTHTHTRAEPQAAGVSVKKAASVMTPSPLGPGAASATPRPRSLADLRVGAPSSTPVITHTHTHALAHEQGTGKDDGVAKVGERVDAFPAAGSAGQVASDAFARARTQSHTASSRHTTTPPQLSTERVADAWPAVDSRLEESASRSHASAPRVMDRATVDGGLTASADRAPRPSFAVDDTLHSLPDVVDSLERRLSSLLDVVAALEQRLDKTGHPTPVLPDTSQAATWAVDANGTAPGPPTTHLARQQEAAAENSVAASPAPLVSTSPVREVSARAAPMPTDSPSFSTPAADVTPASTTSSYATSSQLVHRRLRDRETGYTPQLLRSSTSHADALALRRTALTPSSPQHVLYNVKNEAAELDYLPSILRVGRLVGALTVRCVGSAVCVVSALRSLVLLAISITNGSVVDSVWYFGSLFAVGLTLACVCVITVVAELSVQAPARFPAASSRTWARAVDMVASVSDVMSLARLLLQPRVWVQFALRGVRAPLAIANAPSHAHTPAGPVTAPVSTASSLSTPRSAASSKSSASAAVRRPAPHSSHTASTPLPSVHTPSHGRTHAPAAPTPAVNATSTSASRDSPAMASPEIPREPDVHLTDNFDVAGGTPSRTLLRFH